MKVTTIFCEPAEAPDGMTNVAITVPWDGRLMEPLLALMPPRVTLVGTLFAGGCGGVVGRVMVTVTVDPRGA